MTQVELVKAWLEGANEGKVGSVSVDGDCLIHYSTVIAERHSDKVILNYTRYSLASGKVQKMVTDSVPEDSIIFISGVEAGYKGSLASFLTDGCAFEPGEWLMRIKHRKFGEGYVVSAGDSWIRCIFACGEKKLAWPQVKVMGIVEILEDRGGELH